jgi:hypothetical protein
MGNRLSNDSSKETFAKCKRGNDNVTRGQSCDSTSALLMSAPMSHVVVMKCKKCGYSWHVPVGGSISL